MSATVTGAVSPGIRAALRGQEPTPEQWAAIAAPLGPVHVIAGAGSGKTAVMAARIVYLVEAYGIRVGVEVDADLLSEAQQYQILLGILDGERFEHLSVRTAGATIRKTLELATACADHVVPPARVVAASHQLLERADAGEWLPDWMLHAALERVELARLVERYAAQKRRRGRIDFGDQVAKAVELVERHPDLVAELRARFPHVLLDEYQDTNVAQRRLMQRLCPPGSSIMAG